MGQVAQASSVRIHSIARMMDFYCPLSSPAPAVRARGVAVPRLLAIKAHSLGVTLAIGNVWKRFSQSPLEEARTLYGIGSH